MRPIANQLKGTFESPNQPTANGRSWPVTPWSDKPWPRRPTRSRPDIRASHALRCLITACGSPSLLAQPRTVAQRFFVGRADLQAARIRLHRLVDRAHLLDTHGLARCASRRERARPRKQYACSPTGAVLAPASVTSRTKEDLWQTGINPARPSKHPGFTR